ncbi:MAG: sensor histidine kinase [Spirulina sp. SIO3F2]|nr:sensor histidine kinase [Spirulina sp. SIO3F2]
MSDRHPLYFLRYLEWALLGLVATSEVLVMVLLNPPWPRSLLNLALIGGFAVMGSALPRSRWEKGSYLVSEIVILLIASTWGRLRLFTLLCLITLLRNSFIFSKHHRWLTSGAIFGIYLLTRLQHVPRRFSFGNGERWGIFLITSTLLLALVVVFLQLLVDAVLTERHSREQLAIANRQLRDYAMRAEEMATLQERNRIAREIHDSLGHSLTVFNLHLEAALRLLDVDPPEAKALLQEAKDQGKQALREVRASVRTLRVHPLEGQTLEGAIATLLEDVQRSTGIMPQTQIQLPNALPEPVKTAIYRILQEGLTNICKYAQASQIQLSVQKNHRSIRLMLQDDGQGFNTGQNRTGFGLQGMQERARSLGGNCQIESQLGQGCRIVAQLPLSESVVSNE